MKVEDTVRDCIENFPSLFSHRGDVLHHLFIVNGNGYEWINGELVRNYELPDDHSPFWEEPEGDRIAREVGQEQNRESKRILAELDQRCQLSKKREFCYPLCEHACILNLPPDIQPDWLEAAEEILGLIDGARVIANYPAGFNKPWIEKAHQLIFQRKNQRSGLS